MNERRKAMIDNDKEEVDVFEQKLKEDEARKNKEEFIRNINTLKGNGINDGVWKLREKYFPKKEPSAPVAKRNEEGQIITNEHELKELYLNHFINRMRDREILPSLKAYEEETNLELEAVLKETSKIKTPDWTMKDLDNVLKKLKSKRFDLKQSLLII